MSLQSLITNNEFDTLTQVLDHNPNLANEGIPFDEQNANQAHPLHRICDGVFHGLYSDDDAVKLARLFLDHGATVDGYAFVEKQDTPLIAAASLHAEKVGMLYIDWGANIHHAGCHGGTALHWAAWVGRDKLVQRLIQEKADIHKRSLDFESTPLLWAVHGYKFGGRKNRHHQIECVRLLLEAGADKHTPNQEGTAPLEFLDEQDVDLIQLLGDPSGKVLTVVRP